MSKKFGILVLSYRGDLERASRLFESIKRHNVEDIPVYLLVDKQDQKLFEDKLGSGYYTTVNTEDLNLTTRQEVPNGWIYQQIMKSQFWVSGLLENYISIDSDSVFLRDFYYDDFMYSEDIPYTVMSEQKDFLDLAYKLGKVKYINLNDRFTIDSRYYKAIRTIREFIPNTTSKYFDYGPSPYIWSSKVWKGFQEDILNKRGISFTQLTQQLGSLMSEAGLYGEYLLYSKKIPIIPINPLFKFYHWKELFEWDEQSGITEDHLKQNYIGYVKQSNWS